MKRWETLVDRMVRDVIGDGNISHLPGAGKPLDLNINEHTPDDMRITFKIMQDNNLAPDWMSVGKVLEQKEEKLRKQIQIRATRFQQQLTDVRRKGTILKEIEIEDKWKKYIKDFANQVEKYNKEVLLYNLNAPNSILHKQMLVAKKLIENSLNQEKGD